MTSLGHLADRINHWRILRDVCDTNRTVGLLNFNLGVWAPRISMGLPLETQESGSLAMLLAKRRASSEGASWPRDVWEDPGPLGGDLAGSRRSASLDGNSASAGLCRHDYNSMT